MSKFSLSHKESFFISFLDGIVICPKFSFGDDGYVNNYLNLDFYKWQQKDDNLLFFDPMGRNTAIINLSKDDLEGFWYSQNVKIQLKKSHRFNINEGLLTEFLSDTRWRFRSNNGSIISTNFWLNGDGLIRGYSHENEYAWTVIEDELVFLNKNGEVTSKFGKLIIKGDRKSFYGHLVSNTNHIHALEYLSGKDEEFLSELHCMTVLGNCQTTLMVFFNGAGTPYDGIDTRWEFYHLPYRLGVDFVRFSELSPVAWYLDKTKRIINILQNLAVNYQNVVLVGASAGGFASIYFAEILAKTIQTVNFHSYVINPQTTLSYLGRRFVVEQWEQPLRPILPSDFVFANKDTELVDIADLLKNDVTNVHHHVYYDSENPCENFYIDQIKYFARVQLKGMPVNSGHADSGIKIFESQVLQNALVDFVNGVV